MKTLTSKYQLIGKKMWITLLLLFLLIGCTSNAEREFREADGKMVTVDTTYSIPKENREAKVLESGTYKIKYDANYKENIWFLSLNTGDLMLMDYTDYKNVVDNKILRPPTPADFAKAEQEKEARSKIVEARSVDLGSFVLVAGEEYQGDTIMKVIDANASKVNFNSNQTINFQFDDKYYYIGTQKVTFDYPAVYKITFIKYKGLPWKQSDY